MDKHMKALATSHLETKFVKASFNFAANRHIELDGAKCCLWYGADKQQFTHKKSRDVRDCLLHRVHDFQLSVFESAFPASESKELPPLVLE